MNARIQSSEMTNPLATTRPSGCQIIEATPGEITATAEAVEQLLVELGGEPPARAELEQAARALLADPALGLTLLARANGEVVGIAAISWVTAIHTSGRYALIQDLWVRPDWRGRAVGSELLDAVLAHARAVGVSRVEVGLPPERFASLPATESFYRANGFAVLGTRMRRALR